MTLAESSLEPAPIPADVRAKLAAGATPLFLKFPVDPRPRWGYGRPPHAGLQALLERGRERYRRRLESFLVHRERLRAVPLRAGVDPQEPSWLTGPWLGGYDSLALYGMLAAERPRLYLEVGSGLSTKWARRAVRDHGLPTAILSIDPEPRAEIDGLCDEVVRARLEDVDLSVFDRLGPGDVLFLDSSHVCLMNSDVTVFFLEVLPRLAPGVLVEIHDVLLPWDYPLEVSAAGGPRPFYTERWYAEQYLLAAWLLAKGADAQVLLPNHFVFRDAALAAVLDPLWRTPELSGVRAAGMARGSSFWLLTG